MLQFLLRCSRSVTTQAYQLDKEVRIGKDTIMLHIWDTAGQERFHALAPLYYRDAKVRAFDNKSLSLFVVCRQSNQTDPAG